MDLERVAFHFIHRRIATARVASGPLAVHGTDPSASTVVRQRVKKVRKKKHRKPLADCRVILPT